MGELARRRRVGAYGLLTGADGRVLLARGSVLADFPGVWQLPGGGLEHAEHPAVAVVREFAEETGLVVETAGLAAVVADVIRLPDLGVALHTDRIIYHVKGVSGTLRHEADGTTDLVAWITPAEAAGLPLMPFTADLLGLPVTPLPEDVPPAAPRVPYDPPSPDRRQRFGAYGLVTDPEDRVLLTQIADGYPGAGRWHLPGGGTDHGEQPVTALLREIVEESGQLGRVTALLDASSLHNPAALGPEGRPLDWHGVRVLYRVVVEAPTVPEVTELAGGSTARAAWFDRRAAVDLPLTDIAARALRLIEQPIARRAGIDPLR
ncbi:ADP-ribose pyrophosphatase YjhB, NUDIX family [Micromonospora inyonensis]|uniref:ADP-ribose pyrophosphatase YjhB, NUDIX family n=1 Tax=Micromonospora inyonensis TaxID=47866 RepID=A0A1C6R9B5_9ACTN|nr:ADP-ribose pyrophosphatase YjhB, NUDIX family [Micromonospora inyonensis]